MNNENVVSKMDELHETLNNATTTKERKNCFEAMCQLIENFPFLKNFWEIHLEARKYVNKIVRKVVEYIRPSKRIDWNGYTPMEKNTKQFYIVELLDEDGQLVWTKIGTTARKTSQRMTEHLRAYKKNGVQYLRVIRLWDCGEMEAEMFESHFRAQYMRQYPHTWRKNDRFTGVTLDYTEADKLFNEVKNLI